jgi:putative transposase
VVSPQARREQIAFACERDLSKRRACGLLEMVRSGLSYELRLPAKDAPVIDAMRSLAAQYPRYGYRRIRIFLQRQGHALGWHRAHRLWLQAGLLLPRRRIATSRPRPLPAASANFVWAYDLVFDACANG